MGAQSYLLQNTWRIRIQQILRFSKKHLQTQVTSAEFSVYVDKLIAEYVAKEQIEQSRFMSLDFFLCDKYLFILSTNALLNEVLQFPSGHGVFIAIDK